MRCLRLLGCTSRRASGHDAQAPCVVAMANLFLESSVPLWYALIAPELAEPLFTLAELETILGRKSRRPGIFAKNPTWRLR